MTVHTWPFQTPTKSLPGYRNTGAVTVYRFHTNVPTTGKRLAKFIRPGRLLVPRNSITKYLLNEAVPRSKKPGWFRMKRKQEGWQRGVESGRKRRWEEWLQEMRSPNAQNLFCVWYCRTTTGGAVERKRKFGEIIMPPFAFYVLRDMDMHRTRFIVAKNEYKKCVAWIHKPCCLFPIVQFPQEGP